jgi:septum formation protein
MKYKLSYDPEFVSRVMQKFGNTRIILASNSPRRAEILRMLNLAYEKNVPEIDEDIAIDCAPSEFAVKLARLKADAITVEGNGLIVTADTIVVLGNEIINKPADNNEAAEMLSTLSGKTHSVITAIALKEMPSGANTSGYTESKVTFRRLSKPDIENYIVGGEPFGKAGAYAIQGLGGDLVESYVGDLDNIIGFPAGLFLRLFEALNSEV